MRIFLRILQSNHVGGSAGNIVAASGAGQIIQLQNTSHSGSSQSTNGLQLVQQIVTPSGEVQHIPVRINALFKQFATK